MSSILADQYAQMLGGGGGGKLVGLSQSVQLYTGAQINFGILPPYLNYAWRRVNSGLSIHKH
jgi:hypothetical protein